MVDLPKFGCLPNSNHDSTLAWKLKNDKGQGEILSITSKRRLESLSKF